MSDQPVLGHVNVTFDAGGRGCSVNSNPQRPKILDTPPSEAIFKIDWRLLENRNTAGDFLAQICNVAPCDLSKLPPGYRFESFGLDKDGRRIPDKDDDGCRLAATAPTLGWRWKFTRKAGDVTPPEDLKAEEIEYDLFFSYQLNVPIPIRHQKLYSLRQISSVDPSVVLPPKKSGGSTGGPPSGS